MPILFLLSVSAWLLFVLWIFFPPEVQWIVNFFFRSSLIFSKILGFLERLRTFVKGGKKRRVSFLLLFLLLLSVSTVWGHIQSLGVYIKMHAFAISVCWLYKASLKTYYHCVCFFSLRTVVEKRVFFVLFTKRRRAAGFHMDLVCLIPRGMLGNTGTYQLMLWFI